MCLVDVIEVVLMYPLEMATLLIVDSLNCQFSAMEQVKLVLVDVRDVAAAAVVVVVVFGVYLNVCSRPW